NKFVERQLPNGFVRATGRTPQVLDSGWHWFGIQVHVSNLELLADLEMHSLENGYVGLCRISHDVVNVCGLFRRHSLKHQPRTDWMHLLAGPKGSDLHSRLQTAKFDSSSFCSIAALPLRPQRAAQKQDCCIGDALTMIPPVTGNGMSMAFEAAEMSIEPL